jgi:hypothetical protein
MEVDGNHEGLWRAFDRRIKGPGLWGYADFSTSSVAISAVKDLAFKKDYRLTLTVGPNVFDEAPEFVALD